MKNPLEIDSDDISELNKDDLPRVMNRLLRLEAGKLDIPPTKIETSLRVNDADGGIDARIRANEVESRWLPRGLSIWQFKAGRNIGFADILEEVKKSGVCQGLSEGGTYLFVVSADFTPTKISEMKGWLDDAVSQVYPGTPHRLVSAADVAEWATEHPSMLFSFNRPIYGIWSLDLWLKRQKTHQIPFQMESSRSEIMKNVQQRFLSDDGPACVRFQGSPGIGKTRLALEMFRTDQEDPGMALYASEPPGKDFFHWIASHPRTHAVLIVDECTPAQAASLIPLATMSGYRLRLVTVGPSEGLGGDLDVYLLSPLKPETVAAVVEATAMTLSSEQIRWIVKVARGYIKLAVLLAKRVAQGILRTTDLTKAYEVEQFLKELLPDQQFRRAMKGLALLTRVGWDGDVSTEGEAISRFIGMPWAEMREIIGQAMQEGLVSKQGRYRYVTPEILAHWLAVDEWQSRGQDIFSGLMKDLPTPEARNALIGRIVQMVGPGEMPQIIESFLNPANIFFDLGMLNDERVAQLFALLAKGYFQGALEVLERIISSATSEQLLHFTHGRRYILSTLEHLAWRKGTFARAARLLLRLAEAENEAWGNNATGIWMGLFFTYVGATEVSALDRYPLLQEALQSHLSVTRMLAVDALAKALSVSEVGNTVEDSQDGYVPPKRWHPTTWEEDHAARRVALHLLEEAIHDADEQVQHKAQETFFSVARGIVAGGLAEEVLCCFEKLEVRDDGQRREAWETIQLILKYEATAFTGEQLQQLEARSEHFFGKSLHDRIRRHVGRSAIVDMLNVEHLPEDQRPPALAARLAREALEHPDILRAELPWLMSREAEKAWHFGLQLGILDETLNWFDELVAIAKKNDAPLLLSAYLQGRADAGEYEWREHLLDKWMEDASYAMLVFEETRCTEATARAVERVVTLVDRNWLSPAVISRFIYGGWIHSLAAPELKALLERLARDSSPAASEGGLALLTQWIEAQGRELPDELLPISWELVERSVGQSKSMLDFYWRQVGLALLRQDPFRITQAVLRGVATNPVMFTDERFTLLREAFTLKPEEMWGIFADQLLQYENLSHGLREWFRGNSVLDALNAELLLEWARQEPEERPQLLAKLTKPKAPVTPLIRGLLKEYGINSLCADILAANFNTGFWWGTWIQHEEERIGIMKGWLSDPETQVRLWAQRMIDGMQQLLPQIQLWDEEREEGM